jgi:hypothetical protein
MHSALTQDLTHTRAFNEDKPPIGAGPIAPVSSLRSPDQRPNTPSLSNGLILSVFGLALAIGPLVLEPLSEP